MGVPIGWFHEGNIIYNAKMFEIIECGERDIGQKEDDRRLFWARLRVKQEDTIESTMLFATAHYTWQGHRAEWESDVNLRKSQARKTAEALNELQKDDEPCFFGGDLNESYWPRAVLNQHNFVDCFEPLQFAKTKTHPMRPSVAHEGNNADSVLDWVFARRGKSGVFGSTAACVGDN